MSSSSLRQGFFAHRIPVARDVRPEQRFERNREMLCRCLNLETVVAVVGAGCSMAHGYPSWDRFVEQAITGALDRLEKGSEAHDRLSKTLGTRPSDDSSLAQWRMFALGQAQLLLDSAEGSSDEDEAAPFHHLVAGLFGPDAERRRSGGLGRLRSALRLGTKRTHTLDPDDDPYQALLELPIRRFVTTNYDTEIERALDRKGWVDYDEFGIEESETGLLERVDELRSITQEPAYLRQLTRFSLARLSSNDSMVFHCHGRWDRPGSIVATESDYQRWYLARSDRLAFRHSLDLVFGSNPLLFVGYGLADEDLLQPLRELGATDPEHKQSRPIFALIDMDMGKHADLVRAETLYDRYGVQVVPFGGRDGAVDRGLSDALRAIRSDWQEARDEWGRKPAPREPLPFVDESRDQDDVLHANVDLRNPTQVPAGKLKSLHDDIENDDRRLIGLIGPPGSSKTWHAIQAARAFKRAQGRFSGIYYWNAHYSNEALTSFDRLERFLGGLPEPRKRTDYEGTGPHGRDPSENGRPERRGLVERLHRRLREQPALVILDGCERFMRPTDQPLIGRASSTTFQRVFEILRDPKNEATILLVGRLWPELYLPRSPEEDDESDPRATGGRGSEAPGGREGPSLLKVQLDAIHRREAVEFWSGSLHEEDPDKDPSDRLRNAFSGLCALLDGHNFSLHLVFEMLRRCEPVTDRTRMAEELRSRLAALRPDRRSAEVVDRVLEELNQTSQGLAEPLLRLMTTSLNAMSERTMETCWNLAKRDRDPQFDKETPELSTLLGQFRDYSLLISMPRRSSEPEEDEEAQTYSVHASLRSHFHTKKRGRPNDDLPTFPLAGLASGGLDVDPLQSGLAKTRALFLGLIKDAEQALESDARSEAIDLCRDAYGVLRARMGATTVPRWGEFNEYTELGARLIHLAKRVTESSRWSAQWGQRDSDDLGDLETPDAPLYLGELAWLYNDMAAGLALEGVIPDAVPTFMLADDFARMIEPGGDGGPYRMQIFLNLVHTMIEGGHLRAAESYLKQAAHMNVHLDDPDFSARILGYQAFLDHVRGNLKDAIEKYEKTIEVLREPGAAPNLRARSYFYRRLAGLEMHMGEINLRMGTEKPAQLESADLNLRSARILADEGVFRDLKIEARIAEGELLRIRKRLSTARLHLNTALTQAQKLGSRRLEAEVYCRLSRVALDQGDLDGAHRNATRCIRIANECGLGLRRTHGLLLLGMATLDHGDIDLGLAYVKQASDLADRQQYWIRQREAEEEIRRLEANRGRSRGAPRRRA